MRAQGPGGKGPWSESLPVNIVVPAAEDAGRRFRAPSGDVRGGGGGGGGGSDSSVAASSVTYANPEDKGMSPSSRRPMGFFRPGTRVRDPLTGEVRRPRSKQRPLHVSPPPPTVAALVVPGAAVTARTIAAAELKHRRAVGSNQLLWGEAQAPVTCETL